jgi:ABC-2 type transport system permease protein
VNLITLFQIELIKASRRLSFWVGAVIFTLFGIMYLWFVSSGSIAINGQAFSELRLPEDWVRILGQFKTFSIVYVIVTVIMLTANEFGLKTARQNVIDGLSKEAFFLAKLELSIAIAVLYFGIFFLLGVGFGLTGSSAAGGVVRQQDLKLFLAYIFVLVGYGLIGLFFAFLTRSSGNAMAFSLLYIFIETIASPLLTLKEVTAPVVQYLPTRVFDTLVDPMRFVPDEDLLLLREQFEAIGRPLPEYLPMPMAASLALGYMGMIAGAAYLVYKKRDL